MIVEENMMVMSRTPVCKTQSGHNVSQSDAQGKESQALCKEDDFVNTCCGVNPRLYSGDY
jgi:hypothetical protein